MSMTADIFPSALISSIVLMASYVRAEQTRSQTHVELSVSNWKYLEVCRKAAFLSQCRGNEEKTFCYV